MSELVFGVASFATSLRAQVISYEGNVFPEETGWERRLADTPGAERSLNDGWFVQNVGLPDGWKGPNGQADFYRISLADFTGVSAFFIEWRAVTDNPSYLLDLSAVPAVLVAGGNGAGFYHTTMTAARTQLFRSTMFRLIFVDVAPKVPHTYRLEVESDRLYSWSIDGIWVESGKPEGAYPDPTARLTWGARRSYVDATVRWDYLRYGKIPHDASGDFDTSNSIDLFDFYFFHECLSNDRIGIHGGPGNDAGPGCRFCEFDHDHDVDIADFAAFQNLFNSGQ